VPPETDAAVPIIVPLSNSSTYPVGVPPVTDTLNVNAVPVATFPRFAVNFVVVAVGGGGGGVVDPPPLQPRIRLRMQTSPSPIAARYFLRPAGRKSKNSAAKPVPALSVNHPLAGVAFASSIPSPRALEAVKVDDVANTEQFNVPITDAAPVTAMFNGAGVHVTPGVVVPAVTPTVPVNPPLGVTVTVEFTAAPVAELSVTALSATVKLPICACVTVTGMEADTGDAA